MYRGDFTGFFRAKDFYPLPGVPKPAPKEPMLCAFCKEPWYAVNARTGAPIVMTDKGWKPREPEGSQDLSLLKAQEVRATNYQLRPETPEEFRNGNADFLDPKARLRDLEKAKEKEKQK